MVILIFGPRESNIDLVDIIFGGQAIIRGLPNTIGIPTKKYPSNLKSSFYTDDEYARKILLNHKCNSQATKKIREV